MNCRLNNERKNVNVKEIRLYSYFSSVLKGYINLKEMNYETRKINCICFCGSILFLNLVPSLCYFIKHIHELGDGARKYENLYNSGI
jgi:hypothetical protein